MRSSDALVPAIVLRLLALNLLPIWRLFVALIAYACTGLQRHLRMSSNAETVLLVWLLVPGSARYCSIHALVCVLGKHSQLR